MVSEKIVYALVICNLGHPPHPRRRAGDSHGNEWSYDRNFSMAVRGKYPWFALYRQKCSEMKRLQAVGDTSSGFTIEQSLQGGTFSRDLLDQKSVPAISRGWRAVVTNG